MQPNLFYSLTRLQGGKVIFHTPFTKSMLLAHRRLQPEDGIGSRGGVSSLSSHRRRCGVELCSASARYVSSADSPTLASALLPVQP